MTSEQKTTNALAEPCAMTLTGETLVFDSCCCTAVGMFDSGLFRSWLRLRVDSRRSHRFYIFGANCNFHNADLNWFSKILVVFLRSHQNIGGFPPNLAGFRWLRLHGVEHHYTAVSMLSSNLPSQSRLTHLKVPKSIPNSSPWAWGKSEKFKDR